MANFVEVLAQSTAPGTNNVPGCVVCAVDNQGRAIFEAASGNNGPSADAAPLDINNVFWIASCTKLIGTIAALQCVDRGLIALDDNVEAVLPELAGAGVISKADTAEHGFVITPAKKKITLRHLLTHSSGLGYDIFDPLLMAWRESRGEPLQATSGTVIKAHSVPLLFEPGEGWVYGGGIDWAALLVCRLNGNVSLEEYVQQNICKPLGLDSTTFRIEQSPAIRDRLMIMSERQPDGTFQPGQKPWPNNPIDDCAGIGLYSSGPDFLKIIGDLIKEQPVLLHKGMTEEIFSEQFPLDSTSLTGLRNPSDMLLSMTGSTEVPDGINFGLGALLVGQDFAEKKKETLIWGGFPNLIWFANRSLGAAGLFATQVLPPGDAACTKLTSQFMDYVWSMKSKN